MKVGARQYRRNRRQLRFVEKVKEGQSEVIIAHDVNLELAIARDSENEVNEGAEQREQTTVEEPHQELAQPNELQEVTLKDGEGTHVKRTKSGRAVRRPKYLTDFAQLT